MEDALISPEGFMILSGAGLVDASESKPIYQHMTETIDASDVTVNTSSIAVPLSEKPYFPVDKDGKVMKNAGNYAYVMFMENGDIISEPFVPSMEAELTQDEDGKWLLIVEPHDIYDTNDTEDGESEYKMTGLDELKAKFDSVMVDFYVARESDAQQIEITADKFGGNYYLEASTLFRDQNGVDMPAEFIIPNCKVQSNFTFTMASSGRMIA